MFGWFKWFKDSLNYYIFGQVKNQLIDKIIEEKNVSDDTKDNLIKSIINNKPKQFIEQLSDTQIPESLKHSLMSCLNQSVQETLPDVDDECIYINNFYPEDFSVDYNE